MQAALGPPDITYRALCCKGMLRSFDFPQMVQLWVKLVMPTFGTFPRLTSAGSIYTIRKGFSKHFE